MFSVPPEFAPQVTDSTKTGDADSRRVSRTPIEVVLDRERIDVKVSVFGASSVVAEMDMPGMHQYRRALT